MLDNLLMAIVGLTFVAGGSYLAVCSMDAKNLIESAIFGLLGLAVGLFLLIVSVFGPPSY